MGGLPVDLGSLPIVSRPKTRYGQFTCLSWVVHPPCFQGTGGLPIDAGESITESTMIPGYERFNRSTWVG
ncbi:hypothetical protein BHE74_00014614 [Ensete ventricosum]|nr:hypothetical protein BHE74_00014614 [Ensete ventricosum]